MASVNSGAAGEFLVGTSGNDALKGGTGADTLIGADGDDSLNGGGGDDVLLGGGGKDVALYTGKASDYNFIWSASAISNTVTDKRAGGDGSDLLSGVERLQFSDARLAMDMGLDQAGGKAILTMGATLGPAFPSQKDWAGIFLAYFDTGASVADGANLLLASGIMAAFAGGTDNASLVKFIYANVYGVAPSAATLGSQLAAFDSHSTTVADWFAGMIVSTANQASVSLAGHVAAGWVVA